MYNIIFKKGKHGATCEAQTNDLQNITLTSERYRRLHHFLLIYPEDVNAWHISIGEFLNAEQSCFTITGGPVWIRLVNISSVKADEGVRITPLNILILEQSKGFVSIGG